MSNLPSALTFTFPPTLKIGTLKTEPSTPELSTPEPSTPELSTTEPSTPELSKPEPSKPELSKPEPSKTEPYYAV